MLNHDLIRILHSHYGLKINHIQRLELGADINAELFKADGDGQSYFIKLNAGLNANTRTEILNVLRASGVKNIIFPLITNNGQQNVRLEGRILIVYPFVHGQNGFERELSDQKWIELGKTLRQIHKIKLPEFITSRIRKEAFSDSQRMKVREICSIIKVHQASDEIERKYQQYFINRLSDILRLVDKSEKLSKLIETSESNFVLCHEDIHAGNILIESDDTFYIVDWDNPLLAPKERDLMFIGAGVGNVWNKPHECELFYEGYGKVSVDADLVDYYRCERILTDIIEFTQAILSNNHSLDSKSTMLNYFIAMFQTKGVVDIALSTIA